MGRRIEEPTDDAPAAPASAGIDRIVMIDRISIIFYAARAVEYAIAGAPIDVAPREALLGLAMAHADSLGELLAEIEKAEGKEVAR